MNATSYFNPLKIQHFVSSWNVYAAGYVGLYENTDTINAHAIESVRSQKWDYYKEVTVMVKKSRWFGLCKPKEVPMTDYEPQVIDVFMVRMTSGHKYMMKENPLDMFDQNQGNQGIHQ